MPEFRDGGCTHVYGVVDEWGAIYEANAPAPVVAAVEAEARKRGIRFGTQSEALAERLRYEEIRRQNRAGFCRPR